MVFLSTWNPYAPLVADWCSSLRGAASSRDIKRFSAPNTDIRKGFGVGDVSVEGLFEDGGFDDVVLDDGLLMTC